MFKMLKMNLKNLKDIKIKKVIISMTFCITVVFSMLLNSSVIGADSNASAAASDPFALVTLDYINKTLIPQLDKMIEGKISGSSVSSASPMSVSPQTATAAPVSESTYQYQQIQDNSYASFVLIELTKNQKIRSKNGTLEVILRPGGTAQIVSSFQTQGLADITNGTELLNGSDVPVNHSLIIPRADGRGFAVTSVIANVLVRGAYEIFE